MALTWAFTRAGDRDRTGMASLEGWGSAIELRPRDWEKTCNRTRARSVRNLRAQDRHRSLSGYEGTCTGGIRP